MGWVRVYKWMFRRMDGKLYPVLSLKEAIPYSEEEINTVNDIQWANGKGICSASTIEAVMLFTPAWHKKDFMELWECEAIDIHPNPLEKLLDNEYTVVSKSIKLVKEMDKDENFSSRG